MEFENVAAGDGGIHHRRERYPKRRRVAALQNLPKPTLCVNGLPEIRGRPLSPML